MQSPSTNVRTIVLSFLSNLRHDKVTRIHDQHYIISPKLRLTAHRAYPTPSSSTITSSPLTSAILRPMTGVRLMILAVCRSSSLHSELIDMESLHPLRPSPIVEVESLDDEDKLLELVVLDMVPKMGWGVLSLLLKDTSSSEWWNVPELGERGWALAVP